MASPTPTLITINKHTTTSLPTPHILYSVQVTENGKHKVVERRYSEFLNLHQTIQDPYSLPPKRILTTTFIPSAWVDDKLIAERKEGLTQYLSEIVANPEYGKQKAVRDFLSETPSGGLGGKVKGSLEDRVPSTLPRKTALQLRAEALKENGTDGDVQAEATFIAASYYPDWSADAHPPEGLDYSRWDILFFAFATPNSSSTLSWDSGATSILKRLVSSANASGKGTKIVLSVGGWGGSYWFSQTMSTSANRSKFVSALQSAVNTYGLAGIDIDWEYPNSSGAGNPHSSADAANLLSFLKSLRTALGSSKIISAAVPHLPWLGSNGSPLTDVSQYVAQMTYVNIMNYDVWGASSTPGPNAPLGNLCGTSSQPKASAQAALNQWKAAKAPASKLLLGLPLYGYVSQSTKTKLTGAFVPEDESSEGMNNLGGAHVRVKKSPPQPSLETVPQGEQPKTEAALANLQSWYGQQIPFSSIVSSGALARSGANYVQAGGFTMAWDDCSDTPFLYNTSQKTVVTYDDTFSLGDKAAFAKSNGMAGTFTWSLDQDDGVRLQNVIRTKLGKS